jgi:hypothetical protein
MLKRMLSSVLFGAVAALAGIAAMPAAAQKNPVPLLLCPAGCGPTESDTILMVQMIRRGCRSPCCRRSPPATCTTSAR